MSETKLEETRPKEGSPEAWAQHWQREFAAAREWREFQKWQKDGAEVVTRFREGRPKSDTMSRESRWPLFASNIQTQKALLFGQPPRVDVSRRWADAGDDVARVASEVLERLLNADLERDSDTCAEAYHYALMDRLLPGCGNVRIRYVAQMGVVQQAQPPQLGPDGRELAPAVPEVHGKVSEAVEVDYVHWRDQLWSPARVYHEVRWWAYRAEMSREDLVRRFGAVGKLVPLRAKRAAQHEQETDAQTADPFARAEVWEVWSREHRRVFWYVDGYERVLDSQEDPLELDGFFPSPRPMLANLTTSALVPVPDFILAKDLYDEIDTVSTRITLLEEAVRVAGAYDKQEPALARIVSGRENELVPVDNWALFAEKGGIKGVIDWMPLDQVVAALATLRDYRRELIDALFQVTGMSDIMRGQAAQAGATATEQRIKAQFGSVRMQAMQDEFARFASDVQKLKAEVVSKHFEPQNILRAANVQYMPQADQALAQQAVALLKDSGQMFRVEVKPEAVALADFAAQRQEAMEVLGGLAQFLTAMAPLAQQMPGSLPHLLRILQWGMSRIRGASSMEGMLDQAIQAAEQQAQQPQGAQVDPKEQLKLQVQMLKGQQDLAKIDADLKADLIREQASVQADAQREENQAIWNTREAAVRQQISDASRAMRPEPGPGRKP